MKSYTITFNLKQIVFALSLTFGAMVIYSFTPTTNNSSGSQLSDPGISLDQAKSLYQANANSPSPFGGNLTAVTISKEMLEALVVVEQKVNNPQGYRCYFAKGENGGKMSVLVAVDANGNDVLTYIKSAKAGNFEGCPPLCDAASAITN